MVASSRYSSSYSIVKSFDSCKGKSKCLTESTMFTSDTPSTLDKL